MDSNDPRFQSALVDIRTHRDVFIDWGDNWVFRDKRFNLMGCSDEEFLRFLCETIHPIARPEESERKNLLEFYNREISEAGYKIEEKESVFGNKYYYPVGIYEHTISALKDIPDSSSELNSDNIKNYVTRMTTNVEKDPELVIGTAKEFVENIFKIFLKRQKIEYLENEKLPKLANLVFNKIKKASDEKDEADANKITKQTLRALSTLVQNISEFRNKYGSGHAKDPDRAQLGTIYASLTANAAATLAIYMLQTYERYFKNDN